MKKTPGPRAPPVSSRPSLKMTALSYSWTTFTTNMRLRGRVATINISEKMVRARAQIPGPSSQAVDNRNITLGEGGQARPPSFVNEVEQSAKWSFPESIFPCRQHNWVTKAGFNSISLRSQCRNIHYVWKLFDTKLSLSHPKWIRTELNFFFYISPIYLLFVLIILSTFSGFDWYFHPTPTTYHNAYPVHPGCCCCCF